MSGKGGRGGITYIKQDEPSFLKKFKERIGYKEGPDVNTKRLAQPDSDEDGDGTEKEDEKPMVVVLKTGDLTAEEVEKYTKDPNSLSDDDPPPPDGKILFRKPVKRQSDSGDSEQNTTTSKKHKDSELKEEGGKDKKHKDKQKHKSKSKVKNTSLLSFGEDEEDT